MPMNFNYLGDCYHIALALHRLGKAPLCILYGERDSEDGIEYILIHMGVLFQGNFFDELGNQGEPRQLLKEFKVMNDSYAFSDIYEIDSESDPHLNDIFNKTHATISPEKIDKFMEWVTNNKEKFPFIK